jgi:hypothetical protein
MPNPNDDVLYALRFKLEGDTEAPGEHLAAVRSSPNRVICSRHIKQMVDAHNQSNPGVTMTVVSLTQCTQEELDQMVHKLRTSNPTRVDAADVYPDEKERNRLIAVPAQQD